MHKASRHGTVPHTADLRIEAWARTRDGCIGRAVLGTVESVLDTSGVRPQRICCRPTGDRDDDLLVRMLKDGSGIGCWDRLLDPCQRRRPATLRFRRESK